MESTDETMAKLLSECLPYLTSAKTNSDLPEFLKGQHAALIQKRVDNVLISHFKKREIFFDEVIEKSLENK